MKLGDLVHAPSVEDEGTIEGVVIEIDQKYITVENSERRFVCDTDAVVLPDENIMYDWTRDLVNRIREKYWKQWYGNTTCPLV